MENIHRDTICEKKINSSPEPLSIGATEKILNQMKKCVCKIYNVIQGTGFFIKIPYRNTILPVIITNYHIISENDILNNVMITIYVNNETNAKNIKLGEGRLFYSSKELDVTIIEIKEKEDDIKNFLELDDNIKDCLTMNTKDISLFLKNIYSTKSIYILNYPDDKEVVVSYGQSPNFEEKKIHHKCSTDNGSSGSPILLSHNQKVIGVHYGCSNNFDFNKGVLIIYPIIEFNKKGQQLNKINTQNNVNSNIKDINDKNPTNSQNNNKIDCEIIEFDHFYEHDLIKNDIKLDNKIFDEINDLCDQLYNEHNKDNQKSLIEKFSLRYKENDRFFDDYFFKITTKNGFFFVALICKIENIFFYDFKESLFIIPNREAFKMINKYDEVKIEGVKSLITDVPCHFMWNSLNYKNNRINNKIIVVEPIFWHYYLDLKDLFVNEQIHYEEYEKSNNSSKNLNEIVLLKKINYNDINNKLWAFDFLNSLGKYELIYRQKNELYKNKDKYEKKYSFIPKKECLVKIKLKLNNTINDCTRLFCHDVNLVYIDISNLNTDNVTNMSDMFYFCENLKAINLSSINTQNVTDMSYMFCGCYSLEKINVSSFNTKNVINMSRMFIYCRNLTEIDLSNFDTKKVRNMISMFKYCKKLKKINLSSFNTDNVYNMTNMFLYCYCLEDLDLTSFNFRKEELEDKYFIFYGYNQNIKIKEEYKEIFKRKINYMNSISFFNGSSINDN
jgi:surface protein